MLEAAHKRVFAGFTYKSDRELHGVPEKWEVPDDPDHVTGDCEEFASAVISLVPRARRVMCLRHGKGHLVCELDGWISDCNFPGIVARDILDYKWLSIQDGDIWREIDPDTE